MTNGLLVISYRFFQAIFGVGTLVLSIIFLDKDEFGTYQTMVNLASLSNIFEMGMSMTLVQIVAADHSKVRGGHQIPHLAYSTAELLKTAVNWCAVAGFLFLLFIPIGWQFFVLSPGEEIPQWRWPWLLLVLVCALQLVVNPVLAGLEGAGQLSWVYKVKLWGMGLGALATWGTLILGGKYWAVAMMPLIILLFQSVALMRNFYPYCQSIFASSGSQKQTWLKKVWPLQWRSALGWFSGYSQMFIHVPVIYYLSNAADAGRFSSTIAVVNTVSIVALAYPVSRLPELVRHASDKNRRILDSLFRWVSQVSLGLYAFGACCTYALCLFLQTTTWHSRILSLQELVKLLLAVGFYHVSCVLAIYIRVHLEDPMAKLALLSACMTALLSIILVDKFGVAGVVWGMLFVNLFVYFPLSMKCYFEFKKRYQRT